MQGILKCVIATIGAAALAAPALAQQGGPPPGAQGRPGGAPPPGAQGAPPAGAPGGGPGGAQGAGPPRARPAPPPPNTGIALSAEMAGRGSGYAGVVIDPPAGTVCYILNATLADPPTM